MALKPNGVIVGKAGSNMEIALVYTSATGACLYEVCGQRVRTPHPVTDEALIEIVEQVGEHSQAEWMTKRGLSPDFARPLTGEILALSRTVCDAKPGYYVFVAAIADLAVFAVADTDGAGDYVASDLLIILPLMTIQEFESTGTAVPKAERM
jgi:hypothetical protein